MEEKVLKMKSLKYKPITKTKYVYYSRDFLNCKQLEYFLKECIAKSSDGTDTRKSDRNHSKKWVFKACWKFEEDFFFIFCIIFQTVFVYVLAKDHRVEPQIQLKSYFEGKCTHLFEM